VGQLGTLLAGDAGAQGCLSAEHVATLRMKTLLINDLAVSAAPSRPE